MPVDHAETAGSPDGLPEAIELAAAEWLVRRDRGLDAAGRAALAHWLRADPRHARAFALLGETWAELDRVPADRLPLPPARGRHGWWAAVAVTTAAAAAVAAAMLLRPAAPDAPARALAVAAQRTTTPLGGYERLALPDGSVVQLNTASEIAVDFAADERRVTLVRGEATFDVAKDAARPFVVRVAGIAVRAVGTAFNVRRHAGVVDVLVTEGRVRLEHAASGASLSVVPVVAASELSAPTAAAPVLGAGQRAVITVGVGSGPAQGRVADVAPADAARTLAWHDRQVEFSNEPLTAIAAEFNRYNRHRLVIEGAELGARRFGGKFPAHDFEALVGLLESRFGVLVERRENETVLRLAPAVR